MMQKLDKSDLAALLKGASILTTGGGLCFADQMRSLGKYAEMEIALCGLEAFDPEDVLVTAAEVGPADAPEIGKSDVLPRMLDLWRRMTGQAAKGVYPVEIGQEMIVLETAFHMGVPVADFDAAGGRAVPLVDISSFSLIGLDYSLAPMVVATDRGDIIAVETDLPPQRAEEMLRTLTALSRQRIVYFIGAPVRAGDLQKTGVANASLTAALAYGGKTDYADLAAALSPVLTLHGRVTGREEIDRAGFNCFQATFRNDADGQDYRLFILNEVLFIKDASGKICAAAPDKILLVDRDGLKGRSSAELLEGAATTLMVVRADPLWQTPQAQKLFGADRFSFLLDAA
ncbi:MAG: DUF917 family protein [Micavibrio aeruginosavorus]|nr:DUF917 family protein [Micavibrio aeruginosavorus]